MSHEFSRGLLRHAPISLKDWGDKWALLWEAGDLTLTSAPTKTELYKWAFPLAS